MTHAEFNELMGITTTTEDFDYANFLYMQAGEMTKQEFVKEFKKVGSSPLVKEWKEQFYRMSSQLSENKFHINCFQGQYKCDMLHLLTIMEENPHCFSVEMYNYIIGKVGHKDIIKYKLKLGLELNSLDRVYISETFSKL